MSNDPNQIEDDDEVLDPRRELIEHLESLAPWGTSGRGLKGWLD